MLIIVNPMIDMGYSITNVSSQNRERRPKRRWGEREFIRTEAVTEMLNQCRTAYYKARLRGGFQDSFVWLTGVITQWCEPVIFHGINDDYIISISQLYDII